MSFEDALHTLKSFPHPHADDSVSAAQPASRGDSGRAAHLRNGPAIADLFAAVRRFATVTNASLPQTYEPPPDL